MRKKIKKINFLKFSLIFFSFLIFFIGFALRIHNLNVWPRLGATFDEYAWTWQGINIIQKGIPISWSPHPQYENVTPIVYQKTHFRIVEPFLEHPPVFGIVAGSFALLNNTKNMNDLELYKIRPLAVILGSASVFLVFLLTSKLYGEKTGFISGLLYATIPTIVIGSRIVQNENFFIPFWLLSLYLSLRYITEKKPIFRNIAIIICSLLILAKIPWIAASISLFCIFIFYKKYKDALLVILGVSLALFAFLLYGYYYDWNLFMNLWKLQTARYDLTFTSIFALFQKPYLVDRFYTDGWIYFGWFTFILLLVKDLKNNIFIIFPLLSYFLIFLAGIPDEAGHGWYRYPFYPFLVISVALFIKDYFAKNFLLTFFFLVIIGTSLFGNTWEKVFGFSYIIFRLCIISWIFVLTPYFYFTKDGVKFAKAVSFFWIIAFFIMNIWAVLLYNEQ